MTTPVTGTNPTSSSVFTSSSGGSSASGITTDFETFLRLLTTQATNQDPLEPLDSTEYASQLAQFSMVEQQVQGNELLEGLQAQLSLSAMSTVTQWVGLEARAPVAGYFDGATPVEVAPNPDLTADEVLLVIENSEGRVVNIVSLPLSTDHYEWDGRDSDGDLLAAGNYTFSIENYRDEKVESKSTPEVYGRIRETQFVNNEVVLIMNGGSAINSTDVTALRDPAA